MFPVGGSLVRDEEGEVGISQADSSIFHPCGGMLRVGREWLYKAGDKWKREGLRLVQGLAFLQRARLQVLSISHHSVGGTEDRYTGALERMTMIGGRWGEAGEWCYLSLWGGIGSSQVGGTGVGT